MDKPEQGTLRSDCFFCDLLYPQWRGAGCLRCGSRARFIPAQMMSMEMAREEIGSAARRYLRAGVRGRHGLERLLEFASLYPAVADGLADAGWSLDEARAEFEKLVPELAPSAWKTQPKRTP